MEGSDADLQLRATDYELCMDYGFQNDYFDTPKDRHRTFPAPFSSTFSQDDDLVHDVTSVSVLRYRRDKDVVLTSY